MSSREAGPGARAATGTPVARADPHTEPGGAQAGNAGAFRVLIAGGGVAGLEAALALSELAGGRTATTLLAPTGEFVYRPLAVREPFSYGPVDRYPLRQILDAAGAELLTGSLSWVDTTRQVAHTESGAELGYDALLLATGAIARPRFEHALTIDDRRLDDILHGLVQDIEAGYVHHLAFVIPARMAWPFPVYELALMSAGRAFEVGAELRISIVTPEDSPLAIFGTAASETVADVLHRANIEAITSAYAEVPRAGEVVFNPGDHRLAVDRVVALPELYGPPIRGVPRGEHGFFRVDRHCQVPEAGPVWAAGDGTDFPVKYGGIAAQQADAAAEAIAALAGAPLSPQPLQPVVHGVLLTDSKPLYLSARITGGQGFSSEISETPPEGWEAGGRQPATAKIAARYLAPYLHDHGPPPPHAESS